ncbi:MAG: TROVE domain-containing protein [Nanoarchaeota archaeon]
MTNFNYTNYHSNRTSPTASTPQSQPIKGDEDRMIKNSAGGYIFDVGPWTLLERFLILGTEGGTYYANEREHTLQATTTIQKLVNTEGVKVVDFVVDISDKGRAPKQDPGLFVLAMCAGSEQVEARRAALKALSKVARTASTLFQFASYVENFRGWGKLLKKTVANWYLDMDPQKLQYQMIKYQQRSGWSHQDLLRLSHPKAKTQEHNLLFAYACNKLDNQDIIREIFPQLDAMLTIHTGKLTTNEICNLIYKHKMTREMLPTELLNQPKIWEALLPHMPLTAMIRNLGKMSSIELLKDLSNTSKDVVNKLNNKEVLKKSRIHPVALYTAMKTYSQGKGIKGSLTWKPVNIVVDTLEDAFYNSFEYVEPTGKNFYLGIDVSASMTWSPITGTPNMTPREAAALMAMVTARVEPNYCIRAFTDKMIDLDITKRDSIDSITNKMRNLEFGRTDCALPMVDAIKNKLDVDAFVIMTDNETWCGDQHPMQTLKQYRNQFNKNSALAVVAFTGTQFSIADPLDLRTLDLVGFDTTIPKLISDLARD